MDDEDETDEINEALSILIKAGIVEVFVNEDGERVFRLVDEQ